jgi:hypothetical protein
MSKGLSQGVLRTFGARRFPQKEKARRAFLFATFAKTLCIPLRFKTGRTYGAFAIIISTSFYKQAAPLGLCFVLRWSSPEE